MYLWSGRDQCNLLILYLNIILKIKKFKTKFNKLSAYKGKVHDYLGINIDYSNKNYVKLRMYEFIEDMLKEAREDMNGLSL